MSLYSDQSPGMPNGAWTKIDGSGVLPFGAIWWAFGVPVIVLCFQLETINDIIIFALNAIKEKRFIGLTFEAFDRLFIS